MAIAREALDKLLDLIGGDADNSLAELIESFLDESPFLLEQMRHAVETGDRSALGRAAHTLKSSARDFGASQLSALCETLERSCREDLPSQAATQVDVIAGACDLAQKDLGLHLAELKKGDWPE